MTRADDVEGHLLARAFAGGVAPDYAGRGLANLPNSILRHFGIATERPPLDASVLPDATLRSAERVVLLVIDGLGWAQFRRSPLARLFPEHAPATSVLPSTTIAALATLATGEPPAAHGLLGYRTLLPRVGAITNLVQMKPYYSGRTLAEYGIDMSAFFPHATLVGRLAAAGVACRVVTRAWYAKSELSRMIYRPLEDDVDGAIGLADAMVRARRFLDATRGRRAFLEVYWDEVDTVAHRFGPASDEHEAAVRQLAHAIESELLPACADGKTAVLLTADHGHVHVPRENVIALNAHPRLLDDLVLPPSGEGRFAYLHVREGRREAVRKAWEEELAGLVDVFDGERLVEDGRFGTGARHAELLARVGSLVVVPRGARKIEYAATPTTGPSPLLGNHGGVDPGEMLVPVGARRA